MLGTRRNELHCFIWIDVICVHVKYGVLPTSYKHNVSQWYCYTSVYFSAFFSKSTAKHLLRNDGEDPAFKLKLPIIILQGLRVIKIWNKFVQELRVDSKGTIQDRKMIGSSIWAEMGASVMGKKNVCMLIFVATVRNIECLKQNLKLKVIWGTWASVYRDPRGY